MPGGSTNGASRVPGGSTAGNSPQPGLKDNPGKSQAVFSDDPPYFPSDCKHCAFYNPTIKARLSTVITARVKDCFSCPYIDGCIDRAVTKQPIDDAANAKKQEVKDNNLMPKLDKQPCSGIQSGVINRTNKVCKTLLKHCHHDYDVDAAVYIWNHPDELRFVRISPLGEGKDMSIPKNIENIRHKREDLHFVMFNQYEFSYGGRVYEVKLALCQQGYEQFYSLYEK